MRTSEFNKFINGLQNKCAETPCCQNQTDKLEFLTGYIGAAIENRDFTENQKSFLKGMLQMIKTVKLLG